MSDAAKPKETEIAWLLVGWACAVVWLAALPVIGLFGLFGLAFCDAPGAPCGTYALIELTFFAGYLAMLFLIVRGLLRRKFELWLRIVAASGVVLGGGGAALLLMQLVDQA